MTKAELRKTYLQKRLALHEGELALYNKNITDQFFSILDSSRVKVLHIYLPIESKKEPDTWLIIDRLRREYEHIRLSIPKTDVEGNLENFYFEGLHQLALNKWGIAEPKQGVPTPIEKIDMIIVPLLAFDRKGHRVGYGKGYYDRFLAQCRKDAVKVGLSFFPGIDMIEDASSHDMRLDMVITPQHVFNFSLV